ncbi:MAG TPA: hypothetical protein VJ853_03550 [Thermoanaerobaculia bacterium]|nr:hypothetical protein [Thermoanaerobaculia bacterium]
MGLIIAIVGGIMVLIAAFRESFWWGIGSFLLWPVQLFFVVTHWAESKRGFLTSLCGAAILIVGVVLTPHKPLQHVDASVMTPATTTHATFEQITASIPDREEVKPQPRPAPQPAAPVEEPPQPVVAKVYVDNTTKLYYPSDCATHPDNAFLMSKALAVSQGYKPAACK